MYHVIIWKMKNFSQVLLLYEHRVHLKRYYELSQQCLTLSLHPKVRHKNTDCFGLEVSFACVNSDECIHLQLYVPDEESPQLYILDESAALYGTFNESPDCTLKYGNPRKDYRLRFTRIIPKNLLKSCSSKTYTTPNTCVTPDILNIVCKVMRHRKSKRKITELNHSADFYCCRMYNSDLEYLSTDFGALLQSGIHSDMTIVVNKDHYKVHKFILQSRCPEFYDKLVKIENFTDTYIVQNIDDSSLLWSMLQYIYTGIYIPVLNNKELSEILEAKSHHGLKYVVPFDEVLVTDFKQLVNLFSDKIIINYNDLELNVEEDCLSIFPFPDTYNTKLKVSLFKGLDDENYFWMCFKFQKEIGGRDLFMHCEIEIEQKDKSKQMLKEIEHIFKECNEFVVTSVKIEKNNVDKFLHDGNFYFVFTTRITLKGLHYKSTRSVYKHNNEVVVEKTKASHCKHTPSINAHDYCKNEIPVRAPYSKHTDPVCTHNNGNKSSFEKKLKELQLKQIHSYNNSNSDPLNQLWKNYQKSWKTLFKKKSLADLILQVGDETVQVHKAVLCARSEVFSKMFEHKTIENQRNIVEIQGIDLNTLNSLLSYMYCGSIDCSLTVHKAIWLYIAADRYFIERLKNICRQYLSNYIYYGEYFFDIKVLSVIHNDAKLQRLTSKIPSIISEKKLNVLKNETLYLNVLNSLDIVK